LGAWLGLFGVWLAVVPLCGLSAEENGIGLCFLVILTIVAIWESWGPPHPKVG
jgi:hypothetical protein